MLEKRLLKLGKRIGMLMRELRMRINRREGEISPLLQPLNLKGPSHQANLLAGEQR